MKEFRTTNQGLEVVNGVTSFASGSGITAYHGLGKMFDRPMFVAEALEACHANYSVTKQPILAMTPQLMEMLANSDSIPCADILRAMEHCKEWKATMRSDNNMPLGIVSPKYGIVQNEKAFAFVDKLCSGQMTDRDNTPVIETCGVLGKGETTFVTCKFPTSIRTDNRDANNIDMYVVFKTSHDGSGAVRICVSPVRVCCSNTLNWAIRDAVSKISLRHSLSVNDRLDRLFDAENRDFAYKALNLVEVYENALKEDLQRLQSKVVTEQQLNNILAELAYDKDNLKVFKATNNAHHEDISTKAKNIFDAMATSVQSGIGQEYAVRGTAEWILQGITSYYQNVFNHKNDERKADSILDGYISNKVQTAHDLLITL